MHHLPPPLPIVLNYAPLYPDGKNMQKCFLNILKFWVWLCSEVKVVKESQQEKQYFFLIKHYGILCSKLNFFAVLPTIFYCKLKVQDCFSSLSCLAAKKEHMQRTILLLQLITNVQMSDISDSVYTAHIYITTSPHRVTKKHALHLQQLDATSQSWVVIFIHAQLPPARTIYIYQCTLAKSASNDH